jgi:hypothetical protein
LSPDDAVNHLNSLVSRLQGLKRKVTTNLILWFEFCFIAWCGFVFDCSLFIRIACFMLRYWKLFQF